MAKHVSYSEGKIYTLGQSGTEKPEPMNGDLGKLVNGKGSVIVGEETLRKRADKKMFSQHIILALIDDAKKRHMDDWVRSLWNAYKCQQEIVTCDGRIYGKYCKYRICPICSNIRKAEIINDYRPIIDLWPDPHFLTLTVKSVSAKNLAAVIDNMLLSFKRIKNTCRKRSQRGTGKKLIGIRTLECNFNPSTGKYNPHFHIILADKEMAEIFLREWLSRSKPGKTHRSGQYLRPVNNTERDMIETVKYSAKILTEPDPRKKKPKKGRRKIYIAALNNILYALRGHHVFERFGFNLPVKKVKPTSRLTHLADYDDWVYNSKLSDWINLETGDRLTGYIPESEILSILQDGMDMNLQ